VGWAAPAAGCPAAARRTARPAASSARGSRLLAPPLQRLVTELAKLPGIGNRTAQRLAFHVLRASPEDANALADAIREVKERITLCEVCFNLAEGPRCTICLDERRDAGLICVVEEPGDVIPIERTHEYRGRYHVLGGALSPIDGVEPDDLKIAQLFARVADGEVREVILATNPTTTGEATALHVAGGLHERAPEVAVTRLASGLPVGGDLEYADEVTLGRAFAGRRNL
jgi:recombination protein RecR